MSGATDYAVKPNQFPVFGLMDAIIYMDLKQVSVPPSPAGTHMDAYVADSLRLFKLLIPINGIQHFPSWTSHQPPLFTMLARQNTYNDVALWYH